MAQSVQLGREEPYSLRGLDGVRFHRGGDVTEIARRSGRGLRRKRRVEQGVCGVSIQLRTPKRRKENVQWKRKSTIEEKNVEIYSREKAFSPTSVVIKTNPLFRSSETPKRIPSNLKGELQLNVHQRSYIAKTKEKEMVNAIIDLAKHGEKKFGTKVKRKSLFHKAKSAIAKHQRSKSAERSLRRDELDTPSRRHGRGGSSSRIATPFRNRHYNYSECLY